MSRSFDANGERQFRYHRSMVRNGWDAIAWQRLACPRDHIENFRANQKKSNFSGFSRITSMQRLVYRGLLVWSGMRSQTQMNKHGRTVCREMFFPACMDSDRAGVSCCCRGENAESEKIPQSGADEAVSAARPLRLSDRASSASVSRAPVKSAVRRRPTYGHGHRRRPQDSTRSSPPRRRRCEKKAHDHTGSECGRQEDAEAAFLAPDTLTRTWPSKACFHDRREPQLGRGTVPFFIAFGRPDNLYHAGASGSTGHR